jgi:hypothetical protein
MAKEVISLFFKPDGSRSIEAEGFVGDTCEKATKEFIEDMGSAKSSKKKASYRVSANRHKNTNKQG